ncbi:MAG: hypothetical protein IPH94_10645 [Saprospiraceae bacterium]|nr:hypothetical protein [Saprospiraceae bacterium]
MNKYIVFNIIEINIIVLAFIALLTIIKIYFHFKYLKIVFPEIYGKYKTFWSFLNPNDFSNKITRIAYPWFKRYYFNENKPAERLAKRIIFIVIVNLLFYIIYFGLMIYLILENI